MLADRASVRKLFWATVLATLIVGIGIGITSILLYNALASFLRENQSESLIFWADKIASKIQAGWIEALELGIEEFWDGYTGKEIDAWVDRRRIFLVAVTDTQGNVLYSTDKEIPVGKPNPYWELDRKAFASAVLGIPSAGELRKVKGKYIQVAFIPKRDEIGNVVGIVAVESGAEYFSELVGLRKWLGGVAVAGAIIAIMVVVFLFLGKSLLEKTWNSLEKAAVLSGVGTMAATMAHEIKNPLAIIKGLAEMLPFSSNIEIKEMSAFLNEEVERLNSIVETHLSVVRGQGKMPLAKGKLSVILDKVVPWYQKQMTERGIGIMLEIDEDPDVNFSFSAMRQVVYNLISNACDATQTGGTVKVRLGTKYCDGKKWAVLEVKDTGKGIPSTEIKHLFEPFRTTKESGTGLGLFIVKKIIDSHNGRVGVESQVGIGTKFEVLLPLE